MRLLARDWENASYLLLLRGDLHSFMMKVSFFRSGYVCAEGILYRCKLAVYWYPFSWLWVYQAVRTLEAIVCLHLLFTRLGSRTKIQVDSVERGKSPPSVFAFPSSTLRINPYTSLSSLRCWGRALSFLLLLYFYRPLSSLGRGRRGLTSSTRLG